MKTEREKENSDRKGSKETTTENDHQSSKKKVKEEVKGRKHKTDRKREMSCLFTRMPQCSLLRRGTPQRPYHPICCHVCVSQLISLTKSGIIFQHFPLPSLSLTFFISFAQVDFLIYQHSLPLHPHRCLKRVLESLGCALGTFSAHEDVHATRIKKWIK